MSAGLLSDVYRNWLTVRMTTMTIGHWSLGQWVNFIRHSTTRQLTLDNSAVRLDRYVRASAVLVSTDTHAIEERVRANTERRSILLF
jgi:hypothetical protein